MPDLASRVGELGLRIAAISFTDDELLSARSHLVLEDLFAAAPVEAHRLAPSDLGLNELDTMGSSELRCGLAGTQLVLPHLATL